ncbi:MAG: polysaccharide pyruvyl transferase family protein [Candidatus Omnitrophica bacterium]|nr:polysaccharide pyruvyl transferase family protein [Candidatus Omnitrophota bacterium]
MKIAILSCAHTGNFGDDIIFEGVLRILSAMFPKGGKVSHFLRINKGNIDEINKHDLLVIGGGELLSNSDILEQITSNEINIPYMFLCVGIGREEDIKPYLHKIKPLFWSVRSYEGVNIVKRLGIENVCFQDDPIFWCLTDKKEKNNSIAVCLKAIHKNNEWINEFVIELDKIISDGVKVSLVALGNKERNKINYCGEEIFISDCNDYTLAHQINILLKNSIPVICYKDNPIEFLNILASFKGIVSERLHGALAAYHAGIDFKSIPYHNKVNKFLNTYSIQDKAIGDNPKDICYAIKSLWREAR